MKDHLDPDLWGPAPSRARHVWLVTRNEVRVALRRLRHLRCRAVGFNRNLNVSPDGVWSYSCATCRMWVRP